MAAVEEVAAVAGSMTPSTDPHPSRAGHFSPDGLPHPRHTARGVVLHEGKILLMERWRPGLHYFSIPGGGVEADETPDECAVREILEETALVVTIDREIMQMHDGEVIHHIYLCNYVFGEPELVADAPEALVNSAENRFRPDWFNVVDLPQLDLGYWQPTRQGLIDGIQSNFAGDLVIVSAGTSE